MFHHFKDKSFWISVFKMALAFSIFVIIANLLLYFILLSTEDFKSFVFSESGFRKLIWVILFAPVYGILVSLFNRTVKRK